MNDVATAVATDLGRERNADRKKSRWREHARTLAPLIVLVLLCLMIGALNPRFFSLANFVRIANSSSVPMVMAVGLTPIVVMGSIDLSLEGLLALSIVTLGLLVSNSFNSANFGVWGAVACLVVGTAAGLANGLIHVKMRIPSFMATLGVGFIAVGIATVVLNGLTIRITDQGIRAVALVRLFGLPYTVWIAIASVLVGYFIQTSTVHGRNVYAVGGGEELARLSGVAVDRVRLIAFTLAGTFYAIAGILSAAQLGLAHAQTGAGRMFTVITAVVVGGTALTGGVGGVLHSVVGVLIVGVVANGMILLGVSSNIQQGVEGVLIIVAVALSIDRLRAMYVK